MTTPSVHPIIEQMEIHLSACRYRRAGLVCSTCCELSERAARLAARVARALAA